jgi:hypothetical protein
MERIAREIRMRKVIRVKKSKMRQRLKCKKLRIISKKQKVINSRM